MVLSCCIARTGNYFSLCLQRPINSCKRLSIPSVCNNTLSSQSQESLRHPTNLPASGESTQIRHIPVMLNNVLEYLNPKPGNLLNLETQYNVYYNNWWHTSFSSRVSLPTFPMLYTSYYQVINTLEPSTFQVTTLLIVFRTGVNWHDMRGRRSLQENPWNCAKHNNLWPG